MSSVGEVSIASEEAAVLNILAELQAEEKASKRKAELNKLKKCCPSIHQRKRNKAETYKQQLNDEPPTKKIVLCKNGKKKTKL